ncbi:hypothetical protein RC54_18575 [Herbaspirillum rubrisubalbicans]|uniref:Uncharacterized protein n=1 Tax=Herbaspirillum rubrisubalbicans TaxID=80842 RepID=A0AAD0U9L3_9BURK|nr:hypothetical protein RC54_18575 [Herbaspirillum rubrisubalbicans]
MAAGSPRTNSCWSINAALLLRRSRSDRRIGALRIVQIDLSIDATYALREVIWRARKNIPFLNATGNLIPDPNGCAILRVQSLNTIGSQNQTINFLRHTTNALPDPQFNRVCWSPGTSCKRCTPLPLM